MPPGNAKHDEHVMDLVEAALSLPEADRQAYLLSHCAEDAETLEEVLGLVEWEKRMSGFLAQPLLTPRELLDRPFESGQIVAGRFKIIRHLANGGMGIVYEAFDEKVSRIVALKCARIGHATRLPPEARAASEVSHYNICKVHDLHTVPTARGDMEVISMEYVEGETLAARLRTSGAMDDNTVREVFTQICAGVGQAHRQGVIHGDLKPANVILSRSTEGALRAVITDFGLASFRQTESAIVGGTRPYMAPELLQGQPANIASDVYALGVTLLEMGCATTPPDSIAGTDERPGSEIAHSQLSDCRTPWRAIAEHCVKAEPHDRYTSAEEILAELEPKKMSAWWIAVPLMLIALVCSFVYAQWRAPVKPPPIRLAIMPVRVDGEAIPAASGIARDTASRLERAKTKVIVISPEVIRSNNVTTPAQARANLGATHVLTTTLHRKGDQVQAEASLVDVGSNVIVGNLKSSYRLTEPQSVSKALLATITGALHLKPTLAPESVNAAASADYMQGVALLRFDKWDEALPYLQRANQLDPQSALPYAGLAEAELQKFRHGQGRKWLDDAEPLVERAVSINPDSVPVLLVSGLLHRMRGNYGEAARQFSRATEIEPANAETWGGLAALYGQIDRPDDSIAAFQKAIIAQPDYYANYIGLGSLYLYRARYSEAAETFRRLTVLAPGNPSGHIGLGLALMQQGLFTEAEGALTLGYNLGRTPLAALNLGVLYYSEQRYANALPFFELSLTKESDSITYKDLGDVYRKLGRRNDSIRAYNKALEAAEQEVALAPRNSYSRALIGEISAFLGNRRRAEFELSQALALDPGNATVKFESVIAYEVMAERSKALTLLEDAPSYLLGQISRSPDAKELSQDPRFQSLLHK
jgi:tetratricopeptide (TPR) repeat protein